MGWFPIENGPSLASGSCADVALFYSACQCSNGTIYCNNVCSICSGVEGASLGYNESRNAEHRKQVLNGVFQVLQASINGGDRLWLD